MHRPAIPALPENLEGVDDLSARCFRAFHRAPAPARPPDDAALADHGLHPGQAMCLRLLSAKDGLTQRDLARALHVSPPTVTKMVGSMEQAGLVRRRADAGDARLDRVELTDAGRAEENEMHAAAGEYVERTFGTLTEAERRDLARLLEKLGDRIERAAAVRDAPTQPEHDR